MIVKGENEVKIVQNISYLKILWQTTLTASSKK